MAAPHHTSPAANHAVPTRMDAHVHSHASDAPVVAAAGMIDCPECFSEPEAVYDMARRRGMDLVTITDHDTIKGALELVERGFQGFIPGQEVTVQFPEDRCKLHVLVWGMTPELDQQINDLNLRKDVYDFAAWLRTNDLPHALAHPLYIQNGRLTRWHLERASLLFRAFECLNGAHQGRARDTIERFIEALTPDKASRLSAEHQLKPIWPDPWHKGRTAGSDDHALLNVGRTYTEILSDQKITDPLSFVRRAVAGESTAQGIGGNSSLLAHQIASVGARYYADQHHNDATTSGRHVGGKLLRFAGISAKRPSRTRVAAYLLKKKLMRKRKGTQPLLSALRRTIGPVLEQHPEIKQQLDPATWDNTGAPLAQHDQMAAFSDDLVDAIQDALSSKVVRAWRKKDQRGMFDVLSAYAIVQAAQLPYIFSLFHQNKERVFLERLDHELSQEDQGPSVLERPMRVSLFTDTLGDINGVCRFIQNIAEQANATGRDLEVITSTRLDIPDYPNVYNFRPVVAGSMPKYENLEAVLPPLTRMLRHLDEHQPDVLHISTPGPVGFVGFIAARMLRIPVLGVYHTDFPAYIDHLFDDNAFTYMCQKYMQFFYKPFWKIFTRSEDYIYALESLGMPRERCCTLMPGCDVNVFHTKHKNRKIWYDHGLDPNTPKVLYVGRVSIEKNIPLLTGVWKRTHDTLAREGHKADLIVVGDGPYRKKMEAELKGRRVHFLGFRHGQELSQLYASSDMFVFPSVTDTLGQVVMESQASGIPVIVTDQGGPKEVVIEGETGHVLPADSPERWSQTIADLVIDTERRQRMGAAAHESMQQYSLEHSFEHFWQVHTEAWHDHLASVGIRETSSHHAKSSSTARN